MKVGPFIFDNTKSVRDDAKYYKIPGTPPGGELIQYAIGEELVTTGVGPIKAGIRIIVADHYMQNGFAYYKDTNGQTHRTKDVTRPVS